MKRVSVLCGGRGGTTILQALLETPSVERIFAVINGYDDGMSTGLIRRAFPSMLGPSDFRKVCTTFGRSEAASWLEDRYTDAIDNAEEYLAKAGVAAPDGFIDRLQYQCRVEDYDEPISVGNVVFAALYARHGDLRATIDAFAALCDVPERLVITPVSSQPAALTARTVGGGVLTNEMSIVMYDGAIRSISLYPHVTVGLGVVGPVLDSDAIIFAPGTFHSSLLPSVLLLRERLFDYKGPIVWVPNVERDAGTLGLTWADLFMQLFGLPTHALFDESYMVDGPAYEQRLMTPWGDRAVTPIITRGLVSRTYPLQIARHVGPKVVEMVEALCTKRS
jgi:2-phospho-L-lactate transferase/gluconeogenesis factor (CofD/UPF0052 family)